MHVKKTELASYLQTIIQGVIALMGPIIAPKDSPALLEGLVSVQGAPGISLLQKIPFAIPTFKVLLLSNLSIHKLVVQHAEHI